MEILLTAFALLLLIALPLLGIYLRAKRGNRGKAPFVANLCCFFGLLVFGAVFCFSQSAEAADAAGGLVTSDGFATGMAYLSAALAVGLSGIGGGIAVASSASAALGALSENDGVFGKALIFVGMAEGVALYGLLIAFMIISGL
ncbi:MAG: ATP synthase subunit C [Oscillospiraceae bacterium]